MDARDRFTDSELLGAAGSDPEAFGCFYDRYEASVLGYFMRATGDPEVAADLTAEVFAAALGAAGRYRPRAPTAAAWLFAIAHNTLAKSVRRRRVEARARALVGMGRVELSEDSVERIVASGEGDGWIVELLARLPAEQRDAVRARVVDERSYGEIALELRTSELVVRKRVSRGLATLREELEKPT